MNHIHFIRVGELASYLNVSKVTIWRWRKAKLLPKAIQLSPRIVGWRRETIEQWLKEQTTISPH